MEEIKIKAGDRCENCGSANTIIEWDTCYDDGGDEPNTSNNLIRYEYLYCNYCKQ